MSVINLALVLPRAVHAGEAYLDMHVHVAGIGAGDSGCFIAPSMRDSFKFNFYLRAFGVNKRELEREGDALVIRRLSNKIAASKRVGKAVVLALDGVIGNDGKLDRSHTQVYVPNEYLVRELSAYENLLFGASINPYREDALERLEWVKRHGAVLVKWIPAIMHIDPSDERLLPFYHKLVELELPLLSHAGQERSFGHARDTLGDPVRLALPLRLGVTVIAAHIATTGKNDGEKNFERIMPLFVRHEKLFADISSLTQINKLGYLKRALRREELHGRLVYGSDWPLQFFPLVSPWYHIFNISINDIMAVQTMDNQWDRDVALKEAIGVSPDIFRRSAELLGVTP